MPLAEITTKFSPEVLKAHAKNDATMTISLKSADSARTFWCECDISVRPPLSLAHDKELNLGRTRIGMLKPSGAVEKQVKLYTRPNNFADTYIVSVTAYLYDEDGTIAERVEREQPLACVD